MDLEFAQLTHGISRSRTRRTCTLRARRRSHRGAPAILRPAAEVARPRSTGDRHRVQFEELDEHSTCTQPQLATGIHVVCELLSARPARAEGLHSGGRSIRFLLLRRAHSSVVEHRPFKPRVEGSRPSGLTRSPQIDPIVQRPRTPAFHAGNTGSNPVGVATLAGPGCRPGWRCDKARVAGSFRS